MCCARVDLMVDDGSVAGVVEGLDFGGRTSQTVLRCVELVRLEYLPRSSTHPMHQCVAGAQSDRHHLRPRKPRSYTEGEAPKAIQAG